MIQSIKIDYENYTVANRIRYLLHRIKYYDV